MPIRQPRGTSTPGTRAAACLADIASHRTAPGPQSRSDHGKTFYFHDPNGIRLQIELKTKLDADSLEGDPNPVPYVRALLQRA
jgi:hypothetical protein